MSLEVYNSAAELTSIILCLPLAIMFSGLYEDLPPPSDASVEGKVKLAPPKREINKAPRPSSIPVATTSAPTSTATSSWATSTTSLMPQSLRRRPNAPVPVNVRRSVGGSIANRTVSTEKRTTVLESLNANRKKTQNVDDKNHVEKVAPAAAPELDANLRDPYDPSKPNDYEKCMEEKRSMSSLRDSFAPGSNRHYSNRGMGDQVPVQQPVSTEPVRNTAPLPPAADNGKKQDLHISGEEAWKRRAQLTYGSGAAEKIQEQRGYGERMMGKMGWNNGQGLGRQEQGITEPLQVQKDSQNNNRGSIMENGPERKKSRTAAPLASGTSSRVVLLKNMANPGEVDEDLQRETGEECSKYGRVLDCAVHEVPQDGRSPAQVLTFVRFERQDAATKALIDLDQRYFGGSVIRASFFDEAKFERGDFHF